MKKEIINAVMKRADLGPIYSTPDGSSVGSSVGSTVGSSVGSTVGSSVGSTVGSSVGFSVGSSVVSISHPTLRFVFGHLPSS